MAIPETIQEMRDLTPEEVTELLATIERDIFHLRFKKALHQLEGPANVRLLKHRYSQLKTVQAERKTAQSN